MVAKPFGWHTAAQCTIKVGSDYLFLRKHFHLGTGGRLLSDLVKTHNPEPPVTPTITAFRSSPDRGRSLARDMHVRWALEEVGQSHEMRLVSFPAMKQPAHLALHPFGQISTYEEGDLHLFESGAIVLHIAERHPGLLPDDSKARGRAISWIFAALLTVQMPIVEREAFIFAEKNRSWFNERLPMLDDRVRVRLNGEQPEDIWIACVRVAGTPA